ncbi:MAG: phosphoribosylformylglycinamidine cyclo-ligase, partial [Fibrobacterota bacterium]
LGGFGGMFSGKFEGMEDPVLVSATDGVGTKLMAAFELDRHETVGIDLVAMSVNDVVVCGAKPLFFLDYIAVNKLEPYKVENIVKGITKACRETGTALIGGEMAEMGALYNPGHYDLAGFCVGVVDRKDIIDGSRVSPGDVIYGLPSSGIHSNGFSLVRKILDHAEMSFSAYGEKLLVPTRLYVNDVMNAVENFKVNAIAHITGGGLRENVSRVLKERYDAVIRKDSWNVPEIFRELQEMGSIEENEMFKVFNMGIGLALIMPPEDANRMKGGKIIGKITEGSGEVIIK